MTIPSLDEYWAETTDLVAPIADAVAGLSPADVASVERGFWDFDLWPEVPKNWDDGRWQEVWTNGTDSERVRHEWADREYHVDLGCGRLKKGRIGIDHALDPGVNIVMDLDTLEVLELPDAPGEDAQWPATYAERRLPFPNDSIESYVSSHALEHVGSGFVPLMDEVYRTLVPGGILYAITPLFPSRNAVADPTHVRYFMEETWGHLCGARDNCWQEAFATPYNWCRFEMVEQHADPVSSPDKRWTDEDVRELRVVLRANK